jgi:hypothetical protein
MNAGENDFLIPANVAPATGTLRGLIFPHIGDGDRESVVAELFLLAKLQIPVLKGLRKGNAAYKAVRAALLIVQSPPQLVFSTILAVMATTIQSQCLGGVKGAAAEQSALSLEHLFGCVYLILSKETMIARTARLGVLHYPFQALYANNVMGTPHRRKFVDQLAMFVTINAHLVYIRDIVERGLSKIITTEAH